MPSRRTWLRLISCLVLLLILLGVYGYLSLSRLLEREQIENLEWRGLGLSTEGIQLDQLSLQHPSGAVQLQQVQLHWSGFSLALPFWQQVHITSLQLNLPSQAEPASEDSTDVEVPLEQLYTDGILSFEFKRCISRLQEMQSHDYLAKPHLP